MVQNPESYSPFGQIEAVRIPENYASEICWESVEVKGVDRPYGKND